MGRAAWVRVLGGLGCPGGNPKQGDCFGPSALAMTRESASSLRSSQLRQRRGPYNDRERDKRTIV